MNKRLLSIIVLNLLFGSCILAQNAAVQDADYARIRTVAEVSTLANPACAAARHESSRTDITVTATANDYEGARRKEEGAGYSTAEGSAKTFLLLDSQTTVWGNAGITVGRWLRPRNETSDYHIVRPYITADSVGGNMQIRSYRFNGGYAHNTKEWSWGFEAGYRAEVTYRRRDPRPQNEVGHIRVALGLGRRASDRYTISASLSGESYSQSGTLITYGSGSTATTYQRQGFDIFSLRFMGNQRSMRYRGEGFVGTLSLSPHETGAPLIASIEGGYLALRRLLGSESSLPTDRIIETRLKGAAAHRWGSIESRASICWGLYTTYAHRRGYETVFGSTDLSDTRIIGEKQPYKSTEKTIGTDASVHYRVSPQRQFLTYAAVSLRSETEEYEESFRQRSLRYINTQVSFSHRHKASSRLILSEGLTIRSRQCMHNRLTASAPRALLAPFDIDARRTFDALIEEQTRLARSYVAPGLAIEAAYRFGATSFFVKTQGAIPFPRSIGAGEYSVLLGLYF